MNQSQTILVATKDGFQKRLLKSALDTQFYEVIWVNSLMQVVQWLREESVAALVIGQSMLSAVEPEKSAHTVRQLKNGHALPIIVLSSEENEISLPMLMESAMDFLWTEPLSPKKILQGLRNILKISKNRAVKPQVVQDTSHEIPVEVHYHSSRAFLNFYQRNLWTGRSFVPTHRLLPVRSRFIFDVHPPSAGEHFTVVGTVRSLNLYPGCSGMEIDFSLQNPGDLKRVEALALQVHPEAKSLS